jgi:hypothetical protein
MNLKPKLFRTFALTALLTLGSAQVANARCTPTTYAICWEQYEQCMNGVSDESQCVSEYFACLALRGCR